MFNPDVADKKLFAAVMQRDRSAFEELFQEYYISLCQYAGNLLEDQTQAEDIVQDLFVYLWNNQENTKIQGTIKSYLFTSVKHRALNVLKHRAVERNHSTLLIEFLEDISSADYSDEEMQQVNKIKQILETLPAQCKLVFTMSCLEGKRYKEIADELGISVNTVKAHIVKAYRIIREGIDHQSNLILFFILFRKWLS